MNAWVSVAVLLCLPGLALGQGKADVASYVTLAVPVVVDSVESWRCEDRTACFAAQAARLGVTWVLTSAIKELVKKDRPCHPECGWDSGTHSFPSMHAGFAFASVGRNHLKVTVPFALTTGGLRIAANKHDIWDVLAGSGIGYAVSFVRSE